MTVNGNSIAQNIYLMPRKLIKKYLPEARVLKRQKLFVIFGQWLADPALWQLSRSSVATGVAIGLLCAYMPIPLETVAAIMLAILFRGNILVAAALVWISNPLTWPFMFGTAYLLGAKVSAALGLFEIGFFQDFPIARSYLDLWIGCLIIGPVLAITGYFMTHLLWRLHVITRWRQRKHFRLRKSRKNYQ